jgi:hypothetical protein
MLPANRVLPISGVAALVAASLVCLNCGSSSSNHNLSAAQAQAVSQELFTALDLAMASGFQAPVPSAETPRLPSILQSIHASQTGCTLTNTGESCNIPITYSGPCPNGGTIGVTGDFIFTLDNSGDGSDSTALTVTPTNCAVSNTTFNGDPSVTVATQFSFQNSLPLYPITFTESGGITFGPNPSGSCTLNVNVSVTSATTCSVSGTICGQSVNGSC